MRKTKIICTLGPATDAVLPEMIKAGMNVARMNFSHGSHEEHKARMDAVKAARAALGMPVGIMLDTKAVSYTHLAGLRSDAVRARRAGVTVGDQAVYAVCAASVPRLCRAAALAVR